MTDATITHPDALRAGQDFRFPNGARVGIIFNIAFEGWSPGQVPGIGPMGNVLKPGFHDSNAESWARYGATRGIWRALEVAARNDIRTSVMTNGVLAEFWPDTVRAVHRAGHEIVAHSYGMDVIPVYLDEAGQRENIRRNTGLIGDLTGEAPRGWISPRGTGSPIHSRLLAEAGYLHHGDCNDDDLPYLLREQGAEIVAIPLIMDVNDLPSSIRYGNSGRVMLEQFQDAFDALRERETRPVMLDVTIHTHVYGRPAGAWVFDEIMRQVKAATDVWHGTRLEAAEHLLANRGSLTATPHG
ncbi:polysaccharide deacetylase family protein [Roseomonas populi]|uniref:Chitooligosaccharide deacetylase n=1 Tax=Roseomonas populi TaxID=3121582 RepID=A0ABT1X1E8_9PROT|nr:polysaccharide deacetylase family protein [Roseomonas pecuniae]MCR0981616.1 polysaccharide deacetylase family protein [Roseomonas pecuniae]